MSLSKEITGQILNGNFSSFDEITDENILNICLNNRHFNKLYIPSINYDSDGYYSDGYYNDGYYNDKYILDELLKRKKIDCILKIFQNVEISNIIAEYDYRRLVPIYEQCIKCDLISDEDIIIICKQYKPVCIIRKDFDNDDYYGTYTEITDLFKYILDYRMQYAKHLVTIINDEFYFWYYYLLEDKDAYSEMLKDLLISDIYAFNRIQKYISLDESIIAYGYNIIYIDTIILIMEVIKKYSMERQDSIDFFIYIGLKIVLNGVFPPEIYECVFNDTGDLKRNIYFIIAFCYLNYFENATIEILKDFCQSIYISIYRRCNNINIGIREAINRAPNTIHLQKYMN